MLGPIDTKVYRAVEATVAELFDLGETGKFERETGLQFGPFPIHLRSQTKEIHAAITSQFGLILCEADPSPSLSVSILERPDLLAHLQSAWFAENTPAPSTSTSFRQNDMRIHAVFDDLGLAILFALNVKSSRAFYAVASTSRLKAIEGAYPLLLLLRMWSETTSFLWAHGAAVATDRAAVLLTGIGGAGKSSTALAVTGEKLRLIGDDHVLISPELQAYSIYCTVRLRQDMFEHFRKIKSWFGDDWFAWQDKPSQILPSEKHRHFISQAPLKAIVLLRHDTSDPLTFREVPQSAGFRAITPVTVTRHYTDPMAIFEKVSRIVSKLPVYEFRTSRDLLSMRAPFERFVESLDNSHA